MAEGFDRGTRNEFIDALFIAKGEAGEVRAQLYIASDRGYLSAEGFKKGLGLTDECSRLIQSFVNKVKGGSEKGVQFKHVPKADPLETFLRETNPEMHQKFYPKKS